MTLDPQYQGDRYVRYQDADTGEVLQGNKLITKEMRPGEITTKRILVTNISEHDIRLIRPKTQGLYILQYPNNQDDINDIIAPNETRDMEIEVDVPVEQVTPPVTEWEFDVAVIAWDS